MALPDVFCCIGMPPGGDIIGGVDIVGCRGMEGPVTAVDGAEPLPLPNPQAGQTGEAPGATSITVAQRGHFRRGKGAPRVGERPAANPWHRP